MNWYDQKKEIVVIGSLALSEAEQCDQHCWLWFDFGNTLYLLSLLCLRTHFTFR